jgi:hypothetical protein
MTRTIPGKIFATTVCAVITLGAAAFVWSSLCKLQTALNENSDPSPHQRAFELSMDLASAERDGIRKKRERASERLSLVSQKATLLEADLKAAKAEFKLALNQASRVPRQRAEQLISDWRIYNASEAVLSARSSYRQQTAGYLGAIGAGQLPYPERNPIYLESLHNSSLAYTQSLDTFALDVDEARLTLETEVGQLRKDFLELQGEVESLMTTNLELADLERVACERSISLAQSLGPFLTNEMLPQVPVHLSFGREESLFDQLSAVSVWVEQAKVDSEQVLQATIAEFSAPVFATADSVVTQLGERGEP